MQYGRLCFNVTCRRSNFESQYQRLRTNTNIMEPNFNKICSLLFPISTDAAGEIMSTFNAWSAGPETSDMVIRRSPKKWKQKYRDNKGIYFATSNRVPLYGCRIRQFLYATRRMVTLLYRDIGTRAPMAYFLS